MVELRKVILAVGAACAIAGAADATEYVTNGGLDALAGGVAYGDDVTVTATYGTSAADAFAVYNSSADSGGTTVTELLANFSGRSNVLHITSDGGGLYQFFSGGAPRYGYADVFVVSGAARFYMCSGYCGVNLYSVASNVTGSWQRLNLFAPDYTDELSLYATQPGSEFYVDTISISDVALAAPEPATWAMMLVGFGLLGATMRRSQRARVRFA